MLKRLISILLACFSIMLISSVSSENAYPQKNDKTDVSHVYSILPGTDEWLLLGSLEARREACYVSSEEADSMTTRALAQTVLDYPFIVDIYAFDSLAQGIKTVSGRFPALTVLMLRADAVETLEACAESSIGELNKTCANTLKMFISKMNERSVSIPARSSTYVPTPKGHSVPADYNLTWDDVGISQSMANSLAYSYLQLYPSTTLIAMPSPKYNCHSYAWYQQSTTNKYWIDDPTMFVADNSYILASKAAGRKISYDNINLFIHSGIVVAAGSSDSNTIVRSKWGCNALFTHNADDCPYYDSVGYFMFRYYKLNPN